MKKHFISMLLLISCISCNEKVYLTRKAIKDLKVDGIDATKIQIYTGASFEFEKDNNSSDVEVEGGKVKLKKDNQKDIVRFRQDLPCLIESVDNSYSNIKVVFEQNTEPVECKAVNDFYEVPYLFTFKGESVRRNKQNSSVIFYFYKSEVNKSRKNVVNAKGVKIK